MSLRNLSRNIFIVFSANKHYICNICFPEDNIPLSLENELNEIIIGLHTRCLSLIILDLAFQDIQLDSLICFSNGHTKFTAPGPVCGQSHNNILYTYILWQEEELKRKRTSIDTSMEGGKTKKRKTRADDTWKTNSLLKTFISNTMTFCCMPAEMLSNYSLMYAKPNSLWQLAWSFLQMGLSNVTPQSCLCFKRHSTVVDPENMKSSCVLLF